MSVSLSKGQRISLEKDGGGQLTNMCIGVNWGAIQKKGFFGGLKMEAVDLDASCVVFDSNKNILNIVYFGELNAPGISHSGDDLTGDMDGDDGLDNEIISVNLVNVNSQADQIVFVLNSFQGHDFKDIPFASIRIYEGTPTQVNKIHATFDVANSSDFGGSVTMILGKLYKNNGGWKFTAFGDTTSDRGLEPAIQTVSRSYL